MKIIKFVFPLAVLNLIALILVTFGLPDIVPIHMNIAGAIDGFGSKWYIPIFGIIPIFVAIAYIVYNYNSSSDLNRDVEDKIIPGVAILFMVISWGPLAMALGLSGVNSPISSYSVLVEAITFIFIVIAVFFVFMGHYAQNIKPNRIFGIRTPWTLKNEIVWKKTHKLASYTFMISGFVLLVYALATFISENMIYAIIGLIIAIFLAGVVPIIYSYYVFKKFNNY